MVSIARDVLIDQKAKNISEKAVELNRIEADVSKYLIDEIDKLDLKGDEKIYVTLAILTNISTDIVSFIKTDKHKEE